MLLLVVVSKQALASTMPEELYKGMIVYEIESGNSVRALSMMDDAFKKKFPVIHASALQAFNMNGESIALLERIYAGSPKLTERDYFNIGKIEYHTDRCIPALKAFKRLKNKLSLEEKQEWAFYRSSCFIKLGSSARAAQILRDLLSGMWISHAYFNLAMSYSQTSTNNTKAIVALKVAESLNEGKTKTEQELNDRINIAAGSLYLDNENYDKAIEMFNKVYLDSTVSATALYLRGLAHLENNEFRAATQSWISVKNYPLIENGAAEALLATPFAFEGEGYVGQALEAYTEARDLFNEELATVNRIEALIKKHGVQKVFMEESKIEGLEWFLSKSVATNTIKANYYKYFMQDSEIYDEIELLFELKLLVNTLSYWSEQITVFDKALKNKSKSFQKRSRAFNESKVKSEISRFEKRVNSLKSASQQPTQKNTLATLPRSIATLQARLNSVKNSIKVGKARINQQLKTSKTLRKDIKNANAKLAKFIKEVEKSAANLILTKIKKLKVELTFNNERAEQGLTHILEAIAESSNRKRKQLKLKDGRYQ